MPTYSKDTYNNEIFTSSQAAKTALRVDDLTNNIIRDVRHHNI